MQRILIPLLACFFCATTLLAQVPRNISVQYPVTPATHASPTSAQADMMCNNAGTFTLGAFTGSSNDTDLDTIYLCQGDQIFIDHNGDFDLSGDPNPATQPGIGWAFYTCPPTVMGDNLATVLTDPCILPGASNGIWIASDQPNGDILFVNNGNLQNAFNMGAPILIHFAPITLDSFDIQGFESAGVGQPVGPCVNVNTAAEFAVVYLNAIQAQGIDPNFGNDCLGKFTIEGGYPEFDVTTTYTIDISLDSDPSVKAIIHTAQSQLFHNAPVIFSAPQSGIYNVTVTDGKSCPATFQINMTACDSDDNIFLAMPDTIAPPGSQICVPVTVENFEIVSASFSMSWDPTVLDFIGIQNENASIDTFTAGTLNTQLVDDGFLGAIIYDQVNLGNPIVLADSAVLFEVCFTAIGNLGDCSGLLITNNPSSVNFEDEMGQTLALSVDTGRVCIDFLPLSLKINIVDTTCIGQATMEVIPNGGMPGYDITVEKLTTGPTYSGTVSNGGIPFTVPAPVGNFDNTPASYSVCVQDDNGAGATICDTIEVNIPNLGLDLQFSQTPLCNGDSTGIVRAVILIGGVPAINPGANYTFEWSPTTVPAPADSVQNGVPAGIYGVTVTDTNRNNCFVSQSGTLTQPLPLSDSTVVVTAASCSGIADGSISYIVRGGTEFANAGGYAYTWTRIEDGSQAGQGQSNPIVLSNILAGNYRVTVTDANGCTLVDSVTVTDQRVVVVNSTTVQNTLCAADSTGAITVTVTESSPSGNAYQFFWTPTGFTQTNNGLSSTYADLPAGTYNVLAIDNVGCADTASISITSPAALVLDTVSVQNPGCAQPNSGSITVIAQGGTTSGPASYVYTWDIPASGSSLNGLAVGDYTVTVSDLNGCQDSLSFTLEPPMPPAITNVDSTSVQCGSDGSLSVTAPGAVSFNWTSLSGVVIQNPDSSAIFGLPGGSYQVSISDAQGCATIDTFTLDSVNVMSFADTTLTSPSCAGLTDGLISIGIQGGQPPYVSYNWMPTQTNTSTISNLAAGTYAVTVTDNQGCTLVGSFDLEEPPAIAAAFSGIDSVSCFKLCDGSVVVEANYASTPPTPGDFTFLWDDGSTDSLRTADICAGIHAVTITDGNNCFTVDSVDIPTPPEVNGAATTTPASCFGNDDGTATIAGAGGNGAPYTYLWSDPNGTATPTVGGLVAGEYTVTVTDANGCTGVVDSIFVTEPDEIGITQNLPGSADPNCFGGTDGSLAIDVVGGNTGAFTYEWSDGANTVGNTEDLEDLSAGAYSVTVTDPNGCTGVLENLILQDPPPVLGNYLDWEPLLCNGDETTLVIDTIYGGSGGPYQYSLDFGAVLDSDFPATLDGGEHYITYFDARNCEYTDTIFVREPEAITVTFDPTMLEIELGDSVQLRPIITGALVDTFYWAPADLLLNPFSLNPQAYTFETETYTLTVVDSNGCVGTGMILINVDPNRNVFVPNIFKPENATGLNDHFNVYVGRGVENISFMRVYDRWGELLYERNDFFPDNNNLAEGWDGRFNGKLVNPGVYIYIVEVKFLDGRVLLYRGDVTVIR